MVAPKMATKISANAGVNSTCGIMLETNISFQLPPTIIAVMTYAKREVTRYLSIFTYFCMIPKFQQ
jgi:hypothetical protein